MNARFPFPNRIRNARAISTSMPHAMLNTHAIFPVIRPHAVLLTRAERYLRHSRSRRGVTSRLPATDH